MGPQASGKGTQADLLSKNIGFAHFNIGAILREESKKKNALSKKIKYYLDNGLLVPDELSFSIVKNLVLKEEKFILDGFPRTLTQAEFLNGIIRLDAIILLELDDNISMERITGRLVCDYGHEYHIKYNPPKKPGICDIDGSPLRRRSDDKPEIVKKRLEIYNKNKEEILNFYNDKVPIIRINGNQSIKKVHKDIILGLIRIKKLK